MVDAPEILTVIDSIPHLTQYLNALYECRYADFFAVSHLRNYLGGGMLPGRCRTIISVSMRYSSGLSVLASAGGEALILHQHLLCTDGTARYPPFSWCCQAKGCASGLHLPHLPSPVLHESFVTAHTCSQP